MQSEFILLGFNTCPSDPCVFVKREKDSLVIVAVYIDNMLIFSSFSNNLIVMKDLLMKAFKITDLRKTS